MSINNNQFPHGVHKTNLEYSGEIGDLNPEVRKINTSGQEIESFNPVTAVDLKQAHLFRELLPEGVPVKIDKGSTSVPTDHTTEKIKKTTNPDQSRLSTGLVYDLKD